MPLEIAMKTEELIRALAMDSTLLRKSNAVVGIPAAPPYPDIEREGMGRAERPRRSAAFEEILIAEL
jgi:hypothetical protein